MADEKKFELNLKAEVKEKFNCLAEWNCKVLLSNGMQKHLNDLNVQEIEGEIALGKMVGIFEAKKPAEKTAKAN